MPVCFGRVSISMSVGVHVRSVLVDSIIGVLFPLWGLFFMSGKFSESGGPMIVFFEKTLPAWRMVSGCIGSITMCTDPYHGASKLCQDSIFLTSTKYGKISSGVARISTLNLKRMRGVLWSGENIVLDGVLFF